jgi:biotin synthase
MWREAGADRYLLRHETADVCHYRKLHPQKQSLTRRKKCLFALKELGYQVGSGFMVGSFGQTFQCLAEDLFFLKELSPQMIGIGPFIPHRDTPFGRMEAGSVELTLFLLSVLRLMFPKVLLPATTALGTLHPRGRELGILAGANVVMPNLSPVGVRDKYELYNNKICTGEEAAECRNCLELRMEAIGYRIVQDRGDAK